MSKKIAVYAGFLFLCIGLIGCASLEPVAYYFPDTEGETATISFKDGNPGVSLIFYGLQGLPEAEKETLWDPIVFPAWQELDLTVHAYNSESSTTNTNGGLLSALLSTAITSAVGAGRVVDADVQFIVPPLQGGKDYVLTFRKGSGVPGKNLLVLTDKETSNVEFEYEFE